MPHVLVFAKTPYAKTPYDRWLAGSGVVPVILTTTEFAAGYGHLPHVHAFDDYDTNQLVEKTALRLAREHAVTAVFARAEADVVRAAQLRDLLDLPGQRTASALAFRDKVVMKDHLVGGPVEIPAYRPWIRPTPPWSSSTSTAIPWSSNRSRSPALWARPSSVTRRSWTPTSPARGVARARSRCSYPGRCTTWTGWS